MITIGVTGHRPSKILGEHRLWVRTAIRSALQRVYTRCSAAGEGWRLVSGMALGTDQWAAEDALELDGGLLALVPFDGQEKLWSRDDTAVYRGLLAHPRTEVRLLSLRSPMDAAEATEMLLSRNGEIARVVARDQGEALAVWDGTRRSGTAHCVRELGARQVPLLRLDPRTRAVLPLSNLRWLAPP